jgi:glutamate dehydrogenase (NAD(P)+)
MPTLPDAERSLVGRGVQVLPDLLANWATNAWWWWVVFGDIEPTAEASFARISTTMRRLVATVVDLADREQVGLRQAALDLAVRNAELLSRRFGPVD